MVRQLFLNVLRRWSWLFILATLITGLTGYLVVKDRPPVYQAQAKLLVGPGIDAPNPDLGALRTGGQLMQTYAELAETVPFLEAIIEKLNLNVDTIELSKMIDIRVNQDTQILTISVTHKEPDQAMAITNVAAQEMVRRSPSAEDSPSTVINQQMRNQATRLEQIIANSDAAIEKLEADLAALTESDGQALIVLQTEDYLEKQRLILEQLSQERGRLSDALSALTQLYESLKLTPTNQVKIVEPATFALMVGGQIRLEVLVSALSGLVLSLVTAFSFEYFNNGIDTLQELARVAGAPALGDVKSGEIPADRKGLEVLPQSQQLDSYQMLGTKLLLSTKHVPLRSMLVISPDPDHSTSGIAENLAFTFAKTGRRIILVDENITQPTPGQLVDSNHWNKPADLFARSQEPFHLEAADAIPNLFVLPGYPKSQDPAEQSGPSVLNMMVEQLEERADLVIISAASPMICAESLVLASLVGGVILVARQADTSRKAVAELMENLQLLDAQIIGTILDKDNADSGRQISGLIGGLAWSLASSLNVTRRFAWLINLSNRFKEWTGRWTWLSELKRRSLL